MGVGVKVASVIIHWVESPDGIQLHVDASPDRVLEGVIFLKESVTGVHF